MNVGENITITGHNLLMHQAKEAKYLEQNTSKYGRKYHNHGSQPTNTPRENRKKCQVTIYGSQRTNTPREIEKVQKLNTNKYGRKYHNHRSQPTNTPRNARAQCKCWSSTQVNIGEHYNHGVQPTNSSKRI